MHLAALSQLQHILSAFAVKLRVANCGNHWRVARTGRVLRGNIALRRPCAQSALMIRLSRSATTYPTALDRRCAAHCVATAMEHAIELGNLLAAANNFKVRSDRCPVTTKRHAVPPALERTLEPQAHIDLTQWLIRRTRLFQGPNTLHPAILILNRECLSRNRSVLRWMNS